jgi:hypothetical protein
MTEHARRFKRSADEDDRRLKLHILPKWGNRNYEKISPWRRHRTDRRPHCGRHHTRKQAAGAAGAPITADDARGADAIIATPRDVRLVNAMSTKEAEHSGIPPAEAWRYSRVDGSGSALSRTTAAAVTDLVLTFRSAAALGGSANLLSLLSYVDLRQGATSPAAPPPLPAGSRRGDGNAD